MYKKLLSTLVITLLVSSVYSQLTVTLPPVVSVCEGESVQLQSTVFGGDGNYTYNWTPISFLSCSDCPSPTVTPLSSITYFLEVQDGSGASDNASVFVDLIPFPTVDEFLTQVIDVDCNGQFTGGIDLFGNFGFSPSFSWSGPNGFAASTEDLLGLEAGPYQVVVTNFEGCSTSASFEVNEPDVLEIDIAGTTINHIDCTGNPTGGISLMVSGGVMPYTFLWTGPNGFTTSVQNFSGVNTGGIYSVTVSDANGCEVQANFTITEPEPLLIDVAGAVVTDVDCAGAATGSVDISVIGGTIPYTYVWTGPNGTFSTTEDVTNLSAGLYTVIVTDANGCIATENFTVADIAPIEVTADVMNGDCEGGESGFIDLTVTGGVAPYSYAWSTGETTEDIGPLASGDYNVTVVDANGCFYTESFIVEGSPQIGFSVTDISCFGNFDGTIDVLGGEPEWTYEWSNGALGSTITGLAEGVYCVTVTNAEGCQVEECVTVLVPDELQITVVATDVSCTGGDDGVLNTTVVGGIPPYTYLWNNGVVSPINPLLPAGTYEVTVTDANGCTAVNAATVNEPATPLTVSVGGIPDEACTEEFTLVAMIEGGDGPYSIEWTDPLLQVLGTDIELVNPGSGLYDLAVTDDNGCRVVETIAIPSTPVIDITEVEILSCLNSSVTLDASGSASGPDILYEWEGPDGSVVSDMAIVTVTQPGIYTFTVSNPNIDGCTSSTTVEVLDAFGLFEEDIIVQTLGCGQYVLQGYIPPNYFGEINFTWTFPDGTVATDVPSIDATQTGVYTLQTEVPGLGCTFYSTVFVDPDADACATIRGYVHRDTEDCTLDDTDPVLADWQVIAEFGGEVLTAFTDADGYYEFIVPAIAGTVTAIPPHPTWDACLATQDLSPVAGETIDASFWFQVDEECPQLEVELSTPFLRRCFNSYYQISLTNVGPIPAIDAELFLELDDLLSFLGASVTPTGVVNQTVVWNFAEIQPGQTIHITVQVLVSCDAVLGQVHCSEVFVTPGPDCVSGEGWSGTNLELDGTCTSSEVVFTVSNTGSAELAETVNFIVIEDGVAMMQEQMLSDLGGDQTETYSFPANGSTYTFQLDQVANHPFNERLSLSVEGCGLDDMDSFSTGFVTQYPQTSLGPNSDILCEENIGAYDPNDKQALPRGYGEEQYIEPETKIDYRIRFQNTGTDTAFTVIIRDTLSEFLDLRTLELGNSSHDYTAEVGLGRALTFTFNNILLPDSTTNLEASQGFVDFSIYPLAAAPLETVIENSAAIYFDFNEPVITNTVFHTLGRDFLDVINTTITPGLSFEWNVYPNPASDRLMIQLDGELPPTLDLYLMNALGQVEQYQRFSGDQLALSVEGLAAGWYHLQLRSVDGQVLGNAKLVKR